MSPAGAGLVAKQSNYRARAALAFISSASFVFIFSAHSFTLLASGCEGGKRLYLDPASRTAQDCPEDQRGACNGHIERGDQAAGQEVTPTDRAVAHDFQREYRARVYVAKATRTDGTGIGRARYGLNSIGVRRRELRMRDIENDGSRRRGLRLTTPIAATTR